MPKVIDHPNEPGKWVRLETAEGRTLWRRERSAPFPVILATAGQAEVLYNEAQARARFDALSPRDASQAA